MKLSKKQLLLHKHQLLYNLNPNNYTDTNKTINITKRKKSLINNIIKTIDNNPECNEPEKTYTVAIIYSLLIEKHFDISFYDTINNPILLTFNAKFYKHYEKDKKTYRAIIKYYGKANILKIESPTIKIISEYFYEEFQSALKDKNLIIK